MADTLAKLDPTDCAGRDTTGAFAEFLLRPVTADARVADDRAGGYRFRSGLDDRFGVHIACNGTPSTPAFLGGHEIQTVPLVPRKKQRKQVYFPPPTDRDLRRWGLPTKPPGATRPGFDLGRRLLADYVFLSFPDAVTGERWLVGVEDAPWALQVNLHDWPAQYRLRFELFCETFDWSRGDEGTRPSPAPLYVDAVATVLLDLGLTLRELAAALAELELVPRSQGRQPWRTLRRRLDRARAYRQRLDEAARRRGGTPPTRPAPLSEETLEDLIQVARRHHAGELTMSGVRHPIGYYADLQGRG